MGMEETANILEGFKVDRNTERKFYDVFYNKRIYPLAEYQSFFEAFGLLSRRATEDDIQELVLLNTEDICRIFDISYNGLRNRLSKYPDTLPKPLRIPGVQGLRWTKKSVQEFIEKHMGEEVKPIVIPPPRRQVKKKGRPSYVELGKRVLEG